MEDEEVGCRQLLLEAREIISALVWWVPEGSTKARAESWLAIMRKEDTEEPPPSSTLSG